MLTSAEYDDAQRKRDIALMDSMISGWRRDRGEAIAGAAGGGGGGAAVSSAAVRSKSKKKKNKQKRKKKRDNSSNSEQTAETQNKKRRKKKRDNSSNSERTAETKKKQRRTKKRDNSNNSEQIAEMKTKQRRTKKRDNSSNAEQTAETETKKRRQKNKRDSKEATVVQLAQETPVTAETTLQLAQETPATWTPSREAEQVTSLSQMLDTTKATPPDTQLSTPPTQVSPSPPSQQSKVPDFCPVHSVIKLSELIVKQSGQEPDPVFGAEAQVGLGLFLPSKRADRPLSIKVITEDLVFRGPGVARIRVGDMAPWQLPYSITDLHGKEYVYVPSDKRISCVLFRAQHSKNPTHTCVQNKSGDPPRFVYNNPMTPGL